MDKSTLPPEQNAGASVKFGEWQPIETAPKDGTAVWLLVGGHPYLGVSDRDLFDDARIRWLVKATFKRREDQRKRGLYDDVYCCYGVDAVATHWMPLPEPPSNVRVIPTAGLRPEQAFTMISDFATTPDTTLPEAPAPQTIPDTGPKFRDLYDVLDSLTKESRKQIQAISVESPMWNFTGLVAAVEEAERIMSRCDPAQEQRREVT